MALAEEELSFARADADLAQVEAESAREALDRAVEDFWDSKEYREEIFKNDFASYCIGYEDSRDTVEKLYSDLDLSSIVSPRSKDGVAEEEATSIQEEAPTEPEIVQVDDATPK